MIRNIKSIHIKRIFNLIRNIYYYYCDQFSFDIIFKIIIILYNQLLNLRLNLLKKLFYDLLLTYNTLNKNKLFVKLTF